MSRIAGVLRSGRAGLALAAAAPVAVAASPWIVDPATARSIVELCCYVALAQMWNLLAGYAGLVSVGQQAFLGVSAYLLFALANRLDVDPFLAAGLGLLAPALLAVPAYALLRRLQGPYFAIGTWVLAEVCRLLISGSEALGSSSGWTLHAMRAYTPIAREIGTAALSAFMLAATVGGTYALLRSRYGLALIAIRDNPVAAASQGVDVGRVRFLVYLASAVGCGMVGSVYYLSALRLSPAAGFDINWTSIAVFMTLVGGIGTIEGPLVGAGLYFALDRCFVEYGATYMIVLGLLTVAAALYARGGLWGEFACRVDLQLFPIRRRLRPATAAAPSPPPPEESA
jgi:branched-chain amino acid transport system permease protein